MTKYDIVVDWCKAFNLKLDHDSGINFIIWDGEEKLFDGSISQIYAYMRGYKDGRQHV